MLDITLNKATSLSNPFWPKLNVGDNSRNLKVELYNERNMRQYCEKCRMVLMQKLIAVPCSYMGNGKRYNEQIDRGIG